MQYLKTYGERLVALGYRIVPLPPGSKGPRKPGWQRLQATPEMIRQWTSNGSADDGIGVLAATTPAIDVDITDPTVAADMQDTLQELLGDIPHLRIGAAPKFLIPFRCDAPFKKLSSSHYYDPLTDTEHHVEILADGQQWVAYHEHPDTKQPYEWVTGGLLETPYDQLPVLTVDLAQRVIQAFEDIACNLVASGQWELKARAAVEKATPPAGDPLMDYKPMIDFKTLKSALSKIPNKGKDELAYDQWFQIIAAIHHETEGAEHGRQLAHAWSARSSKHNVEFLDERVWPYIKDDRAGGITGRTILHLAKQYGWKNEPVLPAPASADDPFPFYEGAAYAQGFENVAERVEDVLPDQGVAMIYGASMTGKTFWTLDLAFHVHNGVRWRDKDVAQAPVFYIAAEAGRGIRKRIRAYQEVHPDHQAPFFADQAPDLSQLDYIERIQASIQARGGAGMVVIDTMSASFTGDDSSQQETALMVQNCSVLAKALNCLVVFVHHAKKDGTSWRGSGVLLNDVDAVVEIMAEGEDDKRTHCATIIKSRDGESGFKFPFRLLKSEPLAYKPNGKPITSCTIEQTDNAPKRLGKDKKMPSRVAFLKEVYDEMEGGLEGVSALELLEAAKEKYGKGFREFNYRASLATWFSYEGSKLPDTFCVYL